MGNAATSSAIGSGRRAFQVGAAHDPAEDRADRFARRAAAGRRYEVRRSSSGRRSPGAIGLEGGALDADASAALQSRLGKGRRLDPALAQEFTSLGAPNASSIRVHDDGHADRLARSMSANAFTIGREIFFAKGNFRPETPEGHRMLAHEVGHVGDGGDVHRDVIRRDIGFEFETNVVVRKEQAGSLVPLAKMEKIARFGSLSVEADENTSVGSTIEFVIEHVRESDRKTLVKALDKMTKIAEALTTTDEPKVSPTELSQFKATAGYKDMEAKRNRNEITGKQLFDYEQAFTNDKIHNDMARPLLKTVVPGATATVHFTPVRANLLTANPQVTAGIASDRINSVLSNQSATAQDPGRVWLMSGNAGKALPTAAAAVKDLKVAGKDASENLKGLAAQLVSYLQTGRGTDLMNYAKLISGGMMARTDFSQQFRLLPAEEKAYFVGDPAAFADLVLKAAGLDGDAGGKVFARGVRAAQVSSDPNYNQRAQSLEGITRIGWLKGIPRGYDALSAAQSKATGETARAAEFEGLGRLGNKTDRVGDQNKKKNKKRPGTGVVVEFRGIATDLPYKRWKDHALQAFDYIVAANAGA